MKRLIFIFLCFSGSAQAQKPKNYTIVTDELVQKIVSVPTSSNSPVRLAVVPFAATKSSVQASTQFGEYITETIIGSLGNHADKIKLFERTRLDAILKEHEFILTDLMKPVAALKIGQLAPIDALLSGTYTKLKSYIDVSARLIDVASGEILVSYNGRIKMNKNLAALFPANGETQSISSATTPANVTINNNVSPSSATPVGKSKADICKERVAEFQTRLNDLSTQEKIRAVAIEAMKTPFDNLCGRLHYDLMYSFTRFKIDDPAYKQFLLATLDTIAFPTADDRAYEIVRFVITDNQLDETEWQVGLHSISRIGNYSLSTYLNYLIAKPTAVDFDTNKSRIATYFSMATSGKIGLPRPLSYETAFFEMMEGLKNNQPLSQHVYQTYTGRLVLDDKIKATLFSELHGMYKAESNPVRKTEIIGWISDFVNANDYPKAHEQLYDFVREFNLTLNDSRNAEIKKEFPEADLKILTNRCRDKFSKYVMLTPYPSQQEDRINFCVAYNIPVPGVIPTVKEADIILKGNNLDEQLRVIKLLALMGDRPKEIENTLVSLFERRSLEDKGKLMEVQTLAISVLGDCKTTNQKAIDYMIGVLPHYGNDTEAAKEALVKIGKSAVVPLVKRLDKTNDQDGGLQYQLITILGKIGKDASSAEKSISRILTINNNSDVRYAAEAALQAIKKD
jgi:TolB-like protein